MECLWYDCFSGERATELSGLDINMISREVTKFDDVWGPANSHFPD